MRVIIEHKAEQEGDVTRVSVDNDGKVVSYRDLVTCAADIVISIASYFGLDNSDVLIAVAKLSQNREANYFIDKERMS